MDDRPADEDQDLALALGCSLEDLHENAGRGWTRAPSGDPDGQEGRVGWYVSGEPIQVMLGVTGPGEPMLVARPRGVWRSWTLSVEPDLPHEVAATVTDLPELLARAAASRRRSFRWCRYCRTLTPPEHRTERDVCSDCATAVQGVVF